MAKTLKKAVSVLLCLLTVISVLAATPISTGATAKLSGTTLTLSGTVTLAELTGTGSIKAADKKKVTKITFAKGTKFSGNSTASMFTSFPKCQSIDLSNVDLSGVSNTSSMFKGLSNLTSVTFNSSGKPWPTNASSMFQDCTGLTNFTVSNLNTNRCQNMSHMFSGCTKLNKITFDSGFVTQAATNMAEMFNDCSSLETLDISQFNTSKCYSMNYMFGGCTSLKTLTFGDNFKTDSCTALNHMFVDCSSLESLDVSGFNTQSATTMQGMFKGCSSLTALDVSGFDTSKVELMLDMFNGCSSLTSLDVSGFNTSNVTVFSGMFDGCSGLTSLDLSGFKSNDSEFDNERYKDLFSGCTALDKVKLSDKFSISESMKLTNAKDDYTGWANEDDPNTIVSGDGEYAAFSGAGTYVRATDSPITDQYFVKHSLSLNGDVAVNFYLKLTEKEAETATVSFKWFNKELNDVPAVLDPKGSGYYKVTCPVAVAEMTYDITATLTIGGEEKETDVYSVKQYADVILSDEYKEEYEGSGRTDYTELSALVKAMLDYGTKAQVHFVRDTENLANGGTDYYTDSVTADMIPARLSDMDAGLDAYGLEYAGTSIVYLSATTLRHYYRITDAAVFADVQASFDNENVSYGENGAFIYFDKKDIAAPHLDTVYQLSFNGADYGYAVTDYLKKVLANESQPQSLRELAAATYRYNLAANAYFNE